MVNITGNNTLLRHEEADHHADMESIMVLEMVIFPIIFVACMFGNIMLVTAILAIKHLRTVSNYLVLNLAVCDMTLCMFSIPFDLIQHFYTPNFPFGAIMCRIIYPLATYGSNASVLTLVCIAIERYLAVSGRYQITKKRIFWVIIFIHVVTTGATLPYSYYLELKENSCIEQWGTTERKIYTLFLFGFQYGLPLPLMAVLYWLAWRTIKNQNKRMIEMSEEYERKMEWEENDNSLLKTKTEERKTNITFDMDSEKSTVTVASEIKEGSSGENSADESKQCSEHNKIHRRSSPVPEYREQNREQKISPKKHSLPVKSPASLSQENNNKISLKRTMMKITSIKSRIQQLHNKPAFISHTAYVRHKQTIKTLKMFITVVAVFAIFSCPNQVTWLFIDFYPGTKLPHELTLIFKCLIYANSVVNCWIYSGFSKHFRKSYKLFWRSLYTCTKINKHKNYYKNRFESNYESHSVAHYDDQHLTRKEEFDDMFQQHINGFENYRHLYHLNNTEEEGNSLLPSSAKPKRKITIANILQALSPTSRKSSTVSQANRKLSMAPPIIPIAGSGTNIFYSSQHNDIKYKTKKLVKSYRRRASTTALYDLKQKEQECPLQLEKPIQDFAAVALPVMTIGASAVTEIDNYVQNTERRRRMSSPLVNQANQVLIDTNHKRMWHTLSPPNFLPAKLNKNKNMQPKITIDDFNIKMKTEKKISIATSPDLKKHPGIYEHSTNTSPPPAKQESPKYYPFNPRGTPPTPKRSVVSSPRSPIRCLSIIAENTEKRNANKGTTTCELFDGNTQPLLTENNIDSESRELNLQKIIQQKELNIGDDKTQKIKLENIQNQSALDTNHYSRHRKNVIIQTPEFAELFMQDSNNNSLKNSTVSLPSSPARKVNTVSTSSSSSIPYQNNQKQFIRKTNLTDHVVSKMMEAQQV